MRVRLLCALLGAWLVAGIGMGVVATGNFRMVDRVLAPGHRADFLEKLAPRSPAEERPLLRHLASELNRRYFWLWTMTELGFTVLLLGLVWGGGRSPRSWRWLASIAATLALVLGLVLTPAIQRRGPPLDFVPRPFPPEWQEAGRVFFRLHGAHVTLDLVKLALLATLLVIVLRRGGGPESAR